MYILIVIRHVCSYLMNNADRNLSCQWEMQTYTTSTSSPLSSFMYKDKLMKRVILLTSLSPTWERYFPLKVSDFLFLTSLIYTFFHQRKERVVADMGGEERWGENPLNHDGGGIREWRDAIDANVSTTNADKHVVTRHLQLFPRFIQRFKKVKMSM